MNKPMPSLFISHGAPDILLSKHEAVDAMRSLAARLPRPRAIVIISAHWADDPIGITTGERLPTIHDFGGFAEELYAMQYPVMGDDELSIEIAQRLKAQGFAHQLHGQRGLDHGAWIPLMAMYPNADIPTVQVSLPIGTLQEHVKLGKALAPLRGEGVLIIGSGGSVHNLRALNVQGKTDEWAAQFEQWLCQAVEGNHLDWLTSPHKFPEAFRRAHPTLEHYTPLIVAWSAGEYNMPGRRIHHSFSHGNLGMSFFEFGFQVEV